MYVGLGAKRVRELFKAARDSGKCIVFIDEIDAIGGTRKMRDTQTMRMTLNQLLIELDGFSQSDDIIIIGATNFPELLDPALIRPGRFDKHVVVAYPDVKGRKDILELYLEKVKTAPDVIVEKIARGTPGCSGADLENIVNIAAIESAIRNKKFVTMEMLEYAKDRVLMGAERKSSVLSLEVKRTTAYHEGGHAIVAIFTEGSMPIHKATIIPRGSTLGMVMRLPETDRFSQSKRELLADLDVAMGGRVAEEMIFGQDAVTTGASSDIAKATQIARAMVLHYGMSDVVGPVQRSAQDLQAAGPKTHAVIDSEVHRLIDESYNRVKKLLQEKKPELEKLAKALLDHETLTGDDILELLHARK
eukprot:TRINITY_DN10911_c0_g2_i2.p1 TRINITY_DN10911_c0_g2~~TRINITY_DN10911_c0_g2_i2.p1  ORF type:complete len:361 (-),score=87.72 TRINITY_DN10911_c0_g2_i2:500-1582(-)